MSRRSSKKGHDECETQWLPSQLRSYSSLHVMRLAWLLRSDSLCPQATSAVVLPAEDKPSLSKDAHATTWACRWLACDATVT